MDTVSLVACNNYEYENVKRAVQQTIENLGGFAPYIEKGEKVLLKVNLLMKKRPEEATTTHPTVTQALAELLIAYGCDVLIGDSPGGPFQENALRAIYNATGMESIAKKTGAKLNKNFASCEKENPKGVLLKKITMTDMLNDVDKVISVSKMKTHGMMTMTGAVKNMFGTIPGLKKAEYHLNMPEHHTFADALIDICLCANPVLSIMDGIEAMEGHGPSSGTPRMMNVVLGSNSPYALDFAMAKIIGLSPEKSPTLWRSIERGICPNDDCMIKWVGEKIDKFAVSDFEIPEVGSLMLKQIPPFIYKWLCKYLQPKPMFDKNSCVGCGDCAKNCPPKVIEMKDKFPNVDLNGCIRCFCCQELCPKKAVSISESKILKMIRKM